MIRGIQVNFSILREYLDILNLLNLGLKMIRGIQVNFSTPGVSGYSEPTKPRIKNDQGYTGKLQYTPGVSGYSEPTKPRSKHDQGCTLYR